MTDVEGAIESDLCPSGFQSCLSMPPSLHSETGMDTCAIECFKHVTLLLLLIILQVFTIKRLLLVSEERLDF